MPIKIPSALPARETLSKENIFLIENERAMHQDIRPLKIAILNLMPTKIETETQLLRLIGNTPLQIEIVLLKTASYESKNTAAEHLTTFYKYFDEVKDSRFDGLIITGAPVEKMNFERVDYWDELRRIMDWSVHNVYSTFHICWGAQAGLYHRYGVPKRDLPEKLTGIFRHKCLVSNHPLLQGFDDFFYAPHSRYTTVTAFDIDKAPELKILCHSDEAGVYVAADKDCRNVFVTGHSEYDRLTLKGEYLRDISLGLSTAQPANYFTDSDPDTLPLILWRAHASLLYSNWVNHILYQQTPYDLEELK